MANVVRSSLQAVGRTARGVGRAIRSRPGLFAAVAAGVFALDLLLPLVVLSVFRKPADHFTFNPWLARLPEWLARRDVPWTRKLEFLSDMALGWVSADNPVEGLEWGFIVDVPSLARFTLTGLLFGAYFALWAYRRDRLRQPGWVSQAGRHAGVAGAFTSVLGFSTSACSVMGCGVPVLPVVGLALTGLSSTALSVVSQGARVATAVVLLAVAAGAVWLGWIVGPTPPRAAERAR
jgi:hypothetical protein